jgi:Arc-like DNA binding domain
VNSQQTVQRDETAVADVKTRMREPLRAAMERSAKQRGVSMNAEIVSRLEQSLRQEAEFGGPAGRQRAHLALSTFMAAGRRWARTRGIKGSWEDNAECYLYACFAVVEALMITAPSGLDLDTMSIHIEGLKGRLAARIVNRRA